GPGDRGERDSRGAQQQPAQDKQHILHGARAGLPRRWSRNGLEGRGRDRGRPGGGGAGGGGGGAASAWKATKRSRSAIAVRRAASAAIHPWCARIASARVA